MTIIREPRAILFTLAAAFFTNWVRVRPAATTNMATIITPLLLPK